MSDNQPFGPSDPGMKDGSRDVARLRGVELAAIILSVVATIAALALLWVAGPHPLISTLLVFSLGATFATGYIVRKIQGDRQRDVALARELYSRFAASEKARQDVSQKLQDLAAVAVENARLYEQAQARTQELTNLLKVSETLTATLNAPTLLQMVGRQVRDLIGCDFVAFIQIDRQTNTLVPTVICQPDVGPPIVLPTRLGEGLPGRVALSGKAEMVNRVTEAVWLEPGDQLPQGLHSALCVPLSIEGQVDGLLALGRIGATGFDSNDLRLVAIIAGQISAALENIRLHERVQDQAVRDGLTGVFNRGYLYQRLAEEVQRCEQTGGICSFVMLDIDNFKAFNDRYGHLAGDEMLRRVARAIELSVRGSDIVGRYGGEEFGILLPGTGSQAAYQVGERIRSAVEELTVVMVAQRQKQDGLGEWPESGQTDAPVVTVSLGVAAYPEVATTHVDLVARADEALYRSKALGRNRVSLAEVEA